MDKYGWLYFKESIFVAEVVVVIVVVAVKTHLSFKESTFVLPILFLL
jgi:hypothetical protein